MLLFTHPSDDGCVFYVLSRTLYGNKNLKEYDISKILTELVFSTNQRVYVHLPDKETLQAFIKNAEAEGFKFAGGKAISKMPLDDFYALNKNMTVNYINFIGRVAYQCGVENILRIDYRKFLAQ